MGKSIGKAVKTVSSGGLNLLGGKGGINSLLFGETQGPDEGTGQLKQFALEGARVQKTALDDLGKAFGDPAKIARARAQREIGSVRSQAGDAARNIQSKIAQQGLGKTSLGLAANTGVQRAAGKQIGSIQASIPERIQALKLQRAQSLGQGGANLISSINAPFKFGSTTTGGLAPLIGAGVGGALGGAGGAQVGAGVGQASQGIFRRS